MKKLIERLNDENWSQTSKNIIDLLKIELHNGLISDVRKKFEPERKKQLDQLKKEFINNIEIKTIDDQLNQYTNDIFKINKTIQDTINFDLISFIKKDIEEKYMSKYPNTIELIKYIFESGKNNLRILSIFNYLVFSSTSQSNKSNAGNTGQDMIETMLEAIGVKNYKSQFKSASGSDTDFVFPRAKNVAEVEIFVAVQFSSNDRFRMVSGELKSGAQAYSVTGNGMDASSKYLHCVGAEILQSMIDKNFKLVCYAKEINREISDLEKSLEKRNKDGSKPKRHASIEVKLNYYKNYTISFEVFANMLQKRFD